MNTTPPRNAVHQLAELLRRERSCLVEERTVFARQRTEWTEKTVPTYAQPEVFDCARGLVDGKEATHA